MLAEHGGERGGMALGETFFRPWDKYAFRHGFSQ